MIPGTGRRLPPDVEVRTSEVVVVGAGVAGMTAALGCAPRSVTLLTKAPLGLAGSSAWAQGGVAAAVGLDDSPALHAADTLAASSGLSDREAVRVLTEEGPGRVAAVVALGARFDRADEAMAFGGGGAGPSRGRSSPAPALALGTSGALLAPALRCARGSASTDGTARAALAQGCLGGAPTGRTSLPGLERSVGAGDSR